MSARSLVRKWFPRKPVPPIRRRRPWLEALEQRLVPTQYAVNSLGDDAATDGARIMGLTGGGPAATAGLPDGAVVTKLDDRIIDSADALVAAVRSKSPGDSVTLTYTDPSGANKTVKVTLGTAPS